MLTLWAVSWYSLHLNQFTLMNSLQSKNFIFQGHSTVCFLNSLSKLWNTCINFSNPNIILNFHFYIILLCWNDKQGFLTFGFVRSLGKSYVKEKKCFLHVKLCYDMCSTSSCILEYSCHFVAGAAWLISKC